MQTRNVDPQITVTVRHEDVTDSLRQYAMEKIGGIHLDYPRINPLSPPAAPVQGRLQGPPAKSKFLAVSRSKFVPRLSNVR